MDEVDHANHLAEMDLQWRLMEARGGSAAGASAEECEYCGDPIPEKRRAAVPGCRFCVKCQRDFEEGRL